MRTKEALSLSNILFSLNLQKLERDGESINMVKTEKQRGRASQETSSLPSILLSFSISSLKVSKKYKPSKFTIVIFFLLFLIGILASQRGWSATFPLDELGEVSPPHSPLGSPRGREGIAVEELDRLARRAHGEDDARSVVSGMSEMSIASSRFQSQDKREIAEKLQRRIQRAHRETFVGIRDRRSVTVEIEEGDPYRRMALRLTLERFYPEVLWNEAQLTIPWESLLDVHVRHFQREFNAAEASVRRDDQEVLQNRLVRLQLEQQQAQVNQNPRLVLLNPILRRDEDFVDTGRPRLGGSTRSSGVFIENQTGFEWIGKSNFQVLRGTETIDEVATESAACRERFASDMYAYYGAVVPQTEIARQRITNSYIPEYAGQQAVHVMSRLINGFEQYSWQRAFDLSFPNREGYISLPDGRRLPERGLGMILAVAAFINDVDVIARGDNIGYQVLQDGEGVSYAQTIKIDPGASFDNTPEIIVGPRSIRTALAADPNTLPFDRLPLSTQEEFLLTLHQINRTTERELILFFTREGAESFVLHDARGVQGIVNQLLTRNERLRQEYAPDLERTRESYERIQAQRLEEEQERLRMIDIRHQEQDAIHRSRIEEQTRLRMRVEDLQRNQQQHLTERENAEGELERSRQQMADLQRNLEELQTHLPAEREARERAERELEDLRRGIEQEREEQVRLRQVQQTQEEQRQLTEREALQLRQEAQQREEARQVAEREAETLRQRLQTAEQELTGLRQQVLIPIVSAEEELLIQQIRSRGLYDTVINIPSRQEHLIIPLLMRVREWLDLDDPKLWKLECSHDFGHESVYKVSCAWGSYTNNGARNLHEFLEKTGITSFGSDSIYVKDLNSLRLLPLIKGTRLRVIQGLWNYSISAPVFLEFNQKAYQDIGRFLSMDQLAYFHLHPMYEKESDIQLTIEPFANAMQLLTNLKEFQMSRYMGMRNLEYLVEHGLGPNRSIENITMSQIYGDYPIFLMGRLLSLNRVIKNLYINGENIGDLECLNELGRGLQNNTSLEYLRLQISFGRIGPDFLACATISEEDTTVPKHPLPGRPTHFTSSSFIDFRRGLLASNIRKLEVSEGGVNVNWESFKSTIKDLTRPEGSPPLKVLFQ